MDRGRMYNGRRQHQGRRPPRTPRQHRAVGYAVLAAVVGIACFCGGGIVAAALWLLGWIEV